MHKKMKKTAAFLLAAMMIVQHGVMPMAAESGETQLETAAETQAETQPATQAETQPATQAETQPATQAETQPETQAEMQPATQAETQPETQAETQPATQADPQTEAPQTETAVQDTTEAPASQESELPESESQEHETELWERKNQGKKLSASWIVEQFEDVLTYLFTAESVEGELGLTEEDLLLSGEESTAALSHLRELSEVLADARSGKDVEVVNLYVDAEGQLQEDQLKAVWTKGSIDVTKKYYVVNVIAHHADQPITFSDYPMINAGQAVRYQDETQAGDILYNFGAMSGDHIVGYQGVLTLKSADGLQGTFLAPQAEVKLESDLAGGILADSVHVGNGVTSLLRVGFIDGCAKREAETEAESETVTETESETETETESETETEAASETETEAASETVTEAASETETEAESETETEAESETETEAASETVTEAASDMDSAAYSEERLDELMFSLEAEEPPINLAGEKTGENEKLTQAPDMKVTVTDQTDHAIDGTGTIVLKAAETIWFEDALVWAAEAEVASFTYTKTDFSVQVGSAIQYSGLYFLEIGVPEHYLEIPRVYFAVDSTGTFIVDSAGWSGTENTLSVKLTEETVTDIPVLTSVKDKITAEDLQGVFVLKDAAGNVLTMNDNPKYLVHFTGTPIALEGLTAGTYRLSQIQAQEGYQIADDVVFTIPLSAGESELKIENNKLASDGKEISVTAETLFQGVVLTAEQERRFYTALFLDEALTQRYSGVACLTYSPGEDHSTTAVFRGLPGAAAYYAAVTDEVGQPLTDPEIILQDETGNPLASMAVPVTTPAVGTDTPVRVDLKLHIGFHKYPRQIFSYMANAAVTVEMKDRNGAALETSDEFFMMLYKDAGHTEKLLSAPLSLPLNHASSVTVPCTWKMTNAPDTVYFAETDSAGVPIAGTADFAYAITYPEHMDGSISITAGSTAAIRIQNKLNDSKVSFVIKNPGGSLLADAVLAIKDSDGHIYPVNNMKTFTSKTSAVVWTNLLEDGKTYYLTEITAPEGYQPAPDAEFTVQKGVQTDVVLINQPIETSAYNISVTKQVYCGESPIYAFDTTSGAYKSDGSYRFYAALFSDSARTKKVSDVLAIDIDPDGKPKKSSGRVTFTNLKSGSTYYVAETDEYGVVQKTNADCTVRYAGNGKVTMSNKNMTTVIQNVFTKVPDGYRMTGKLLIEKKVLDKEGKPEKVSETFYIGIYRDEAFQDKVGVKKVVLNNADSGTAEAEFILPQSGEKTYYIAEENKEGKRVTSELAFSYVPAIDHPSITVVSGDTAHVTVTNKRINSTMILYLTKSVREGAVPKKVTQSFYAALYKDKDFKEKYTETLIPLKLKDAAEITQKITLDIGKEPEATIYVAEVNEKGELIKDEASFGYQIRVSGNSTAKFTQEKSEIQVVIINGVYGTMTDSDFHSAIGSYGDLVSQSGLAGNGYSGDGSVSTADETPLQKIWIALILSAMALAAGMWIRRQQKIG